MQERLLTIYYGVDRLPYKDENREVHYPIVSSQSGGTLITGENNTSKLYFYVGQIGGGARQWIANIKKPDGSLSYQLCTSGQSVTLSNGQTDYRVELDIGGIFADQIGDVFIGLQGYSGDTVINETEEGYYEISGDPIVLATGTIKIKVNYAPSVLPKGETITPTTEQQIMAALGGKIDITSAIFVVNDISSFDYDSYSSGQVFFDLASGQFYKLVGSTLTLITLELDDMLIDGQTLTTYFSQYLTSTEIAQNYVAKVDLSSIVYGRNSLNQESTFGVDPDNSYGQNTLAKRYNGQLKAPTPTDNSHLANKGYVDSSIQSAIESIEEKADVSDIVGTYSDLEDYDTSSLVIGDIIKVLQDSTHSGAMTYYRWLGSDDGWEYIGSEGPYYTQSETNSLLGAKLDKSTSHNKVYGTDNSGSQATFDVDYGTTFTGKVVRRDSNDQVYVPLTPTANGHASSKKYVDDALALKEDIANKVTSLSASSTDTQYPSAKCVYDITQHLEEIADGRAKNYEISYSDTVASVKAYLQDNPTAKVYNDSGTDITSAVLSGNYDSVTILNSLFNSQASSIEIPSGANDKYLICKSISSGFTADGLIFVKIEEQGRQQSMKIGDVIYVVETNVPDRWFGFDNGDPYFYELETALSNYYAKNASIIPTIDNVYDVGSSSYRIKDIHALKTILYRADGSMKWELFGDNYNNLVVSRDGVNRYGFQYNSFVPLSSSQSLGTSSYVWTYCYATNVSNGTLGYSVEDSYSILFGKYVADNTITTLPYETISQISLSSDTTFSLKSAPTGCYPIYDAIITNVGSSAINITLTSVAKIICNDASITISNNVVTLPAGMVVELNIQNGCALIINFDL